MNLIKLLEQMKIDQSITDEPIRFLLFKEIHLEDGFMPIYWGGYGQLFNKVTLNKYFQNKLSYDEILQAVDLTTLDLPYQDEFFPLIKERLEEIKSLSVPVFNSEKMSILNSFILSSNSFISLPYIRKSIHKHELLTLLALTEWDFWFQTCAGWGVLYTALTLKFTSIFDICELEIYIPFNEMKQLIEQLTSCHNDIFYKDLELTEIEMSEDKEILTKTFSLNMQSV